MTALRTRRDTAQDGLDRVTRLRAAQRQRVRAARESTELADRALERARAAHATDQRALSDARQTYGSAVPGTEWDAESDDQDAATRRERSAPWMDEDFARSRSELFLAALDLHRALLATEPSLVRKSMLAAMDVISGSAPKDLEPQQIRAAWQLLFLIVPVVSTTFASLDRMFTGLGSESLGWLFVDEAGQAAPQQVAGALWRARRAVVVGDPLQLEPVVSLPWTAQQRLRAHFGVAEEWTPGRTSVQRLSDRLVPHGTTLPGPDGDPVWVGSPLRVHRRCDRLMFDISNVIAYDKMMVFGTGERPGYPTVARSALLSYDVTAPDAQGKWIPQEGRVLGKTLDTIEERLLVELREEYDNAPPDEPPTWAATGSADRRPADPVRAEMRRRLAQRVFVISPFRDVVAGIENIAKGRLPTAARADRSAPSRRFKARKPTSSSSSWAPGPTSAAPATGRPSPPTSSTSPSAAPAAASSSSATTPPGPATATSPNSPATSTSPSPTPPNGSRHKRRPTVDQDPEHDRRPDLCGGRCTRFR